MGIKGQGFKTPGVLIGQTLPEDSAEPYTPLTGPDLSERQS